MAENRTNIKKALERLRDPRRRGTLRDYIEE